MRSSRSDGKTGWGELRILTVVLGGGVLMVWVGSYFVGLQWYGSAWSGTPEAAREEARWFVSNHGSIGLSWRVQSGKLGGALPANESAFSVIDAGPSELAHVHPEGSLAWHWIQHNPGEEMMMGGMRTTHGHMYLPYWMPLLAIGLVAGGLTMKMRRSDP